jgi:hypothetical protein
VTKRRWTEDDYWNMKGYQCYDVHSRMDAVMWCLKKTIEDWEPDMNLPPMCEHAASIPSFAKRRVEISHNDPDTVSCKSRAEWHVINKTSSLQYEYCAHHLQMNLTPGHTYSIFPARSRAKEDGLGLTMGEAKHRNVCRICGEKAGARKREDGSMESFWLGHGHEFAHDDCLSPAAKERMYRRVAETGPHRMD